MKTLSILAVSLSALIAGGAAIAQPGYGQPGYGQPGYGQPGYGPPNGAHYRHGGGDGPPRAMLFTKPGFQGRRLLVDHGITKLSHHDFDDRASSIKLRGRWLICVDDNFHGHCETIDHPIDDLATINMDDKISSIRPIGGGGPQPGY